MSDETPSGRTVNWKHVFAALNGFGEVMMEMNVPISGARMGDAIEDLPELVECRKVCRATVAKGPENPEVKQAPLLMHFIRWTPYFFDVLGGESSVMILRSAFMAVSIVENDVSVVDFERAWIPEELGSTSTRLVTVMETPQERAKKVLQRILGNGS